MFLGNTPGWIHIVSVRIIKESFFKAATAGHSRSVEALRIWVTIVRAASWRNPVEMKQTFSDVDPVKVKSGQTVYVFNIRRNEFRLVAAVHFNQQRVYTLRFMTHAEYNRAAWKQEL